MIFCGTGHRPDKLGGYGEAAFENLRKIAREHLDCMVNLYPKVEVVSGMALGWDLALAQAAFDLSIWYTAAIPCDNQCDRWPPASRKLWAKLINRSHNTVLVTPGPYKPEVMQIRNEWMVDNSSYVIAMYDGSAGGTCNCIKYANKMGRSITNLYPKYLATTSEGIF